MSDIDPTRKALYDAFENREIETPQGFFAKLDAENDENGVREALAAKRYNSRRAALAEEWLRRREESRCTESSARIEEREIETLSVARKANDIARSASFAATAAAAAASEANAIARSNR